MDASSLSQQFEPRQLYVPGLRNSHRSPVSFIDTPDGPLFLASDVHKLVYAERSLSSWLSQLRREPRLVEVEGTRQPVLTGADLLKLVCREQGEQEEHLETIVDQLTSQPFLRFLCGVSALPKPWRDPLAAAALSPRAPAVRTPRALAPAAAAAAAAAEPEAGESSEASRLHGSPGADSRTPPISAQLCPAPPRLRADAKVAAVRRVFLEYCAFGRGSSLPSDTLGDFMFSKMCKDAGLVDRRFSQADVDMVFQRAKRRTAKRISFEEFCVALRMIAEDILDRRAPAAKHGSSAAGLAGVVEAILAMSGPRLNTSIPEQELFKFLGTSQDEASMLAASAHRRSHGPEGPDGRPRSAPGPGSVSGSGPKSARARRQRDGPVYDLHLILRPGLS
eukprot:tig00000145_g8825.t1